MVVFLAVAALMSPHAMREGPPSWHCDARLVAGSSACIWLMAHSEFRMLADEARGGNIRAANRLGDFYLMKKSPAEARAWWRLAALRGDCGAIAKLAVLKPADGETSRWKKSAKAQRCSPPRYEHW